MTLKEIQELYERCLLGKATPEEQQLFEEYKDEFDLTDIPWISEMGDRKEIKSKLEEDLDRMIKRRTINRNRYYLPVAASILIAFGIAWFALKDKNKPETGFQASNTQHAIKPGENKAILILANSKSIALDSSKLGNVAVQSNTAIVKNQKQLLQYQPNNATVDNTKAPDYNTLITPRGGQYNLLLSDGTKFWLNADSRLRFPVNFTGNDRIVELTGEAYFEVAKNKSKPFKVITGSKTVEVLGTHFNVSAYPNETYRTTLLEGSVMLKSIYGGPALLKPGEQGIFDGQSIFNVLKADTAEAVAWKNGIFMFKKDGIADIMKQISRWYDVDVDYKGDVSHVKLGGSVSSVSRYSNIASLLNTIQLTGSVHFKIEGRRVIVMK
jgi:transmembrane sensor